MTDYQPEERPESVDPPIRARVPERVAAGAFSTGVIVMTAQSEFILDFVQNLGRPHQIVARVVMPHHVLPQLVDALRRNIDLYVGRWGELPTAGQPSSSISPGAATGTPTESGGTHPPQSAVEAHQPGGPSGAAGATNVPVQGEPSVGPASGGAGSGASGGAGGHDWRAEPVSGSSESSRGGEPQRRSADAELHKPTVQEIYDDLKVRDEFLSGAYANAVMIGHGPHEFSFDFITNFYPHSAVSARVFLAAGQIPRFYESLQGTWQQLRARMQPPPGRRPSPPPTDPNDRDDNPFV